MADQPRNASRLPQSRGDLIEKGVLLAGSAEALLPGGSLEVRLKTTRGEFTTILHPADGSQGGVIWLSGARGGLNGPAGGLYATLSYALVSSGVSSLRLHYRQPNHIPSCVADVLVGIDFLKQRGARRFALVGHSFGAAVAITAGAISRDVVAVATLAGQTFGTDMVPNLSPRSLLVVHGTWDVVLDSACAHNIYSRARDPKRLVIFPGASHALTECQAELEDLLAGWLIENVGGEKPVADWYDLPPVAARISGRPAKEIRVCVGDITEVRADGLVCPANEELTMWDGVAAAISRRGGGGIALEAAAMAPRRPGETIVTSAGQLAAKYILHAVISAPRQGLPMPLEDTLATAVEGCFAAAEAMELKSIAFPTVGAVGHISLERAAAILLKAAAERLKAATALRTVTFIVSGAGTYRAFTAAMSQLFARWA